MTDLFAADLQRILRRPFTRALGIAALVTIALAGLIVFFYSGAAHPYPLTGLRAGVAAAAAPLALAGFIMGAALFGADYSSRALTTLLTWEPRRPRVLAAQAAACAAVAGCAALVVLALLCVALLPAALAHGGGAVPTTGWYLSLFNLALRCALLAAAASAIGVSLAAIGRSTVAALASVALYWIVVEQAARGLWPSLSNWLFLVDAQSWVAASSRSGVALPGGRGSGHTIVTAGLLLLTAVLALHALASWMLSHRDIA